MNWTKEMLDAVKGNEVPHGLLKANAGKYFRTSSAVPLWQLIQLAAKAGAGIEVWGVDCWWPFDGTFDSQLAYRVSPSWQPPKPKTLEEERREFMDAAFKRGNVVRFSTESAHKYVKEWSDGNSMPVRAYLSTCEHTVHYTYKGYTLTEMTPAEAEADCRNRGGKVPEGEGETKATEGFTAYRFAVNGNDVVKITETYGPDGHLLNQTAKRVP